MIGNEAESLGSIECNVPPLPSRLDPWRETGKRQTLINVALRHAKALSDLGWRGAIGYQRRKRINLVHSVHGDTMDILDERHLPARLSSDDVAGDRMILGNETRLGQQLERLASPVAGVDFVPSCVCGHDA